MQDLEPQEIARLLEKIRQLDAEGPATESWSHFATADWPALFRLLDLGADLPRLRDNAALAAWPSALWPELSALSTDLIKIQYLVDHPAVPSTARLCTAHPLASLDRAKKELEHYHCTTIEGFFDQDQQGRLLELIDGLRVSRAGTWASLERDDSPDLVQLVEEGLRGQVFPRLTDFDLRRDEYSITLSLQDLQPTGIGWHRDLYWPKEWVGQDVFALFYALGSDSAEKGGAFISYHPEDGAHSEGGEIRAIYRQEHSATVLWNGRRDADRPFHAVAGYHGTDTARHLLILQCLRKSA